MAQATGLARIGLDAPVPQQLGHHWCWAACACAVAKFYDDASAWTQCTVANAVLDRDHCCRDVSGCDKPAFVYDALEVTGNLAWKSVGPVKRSALLSELVQGRVVVARIQWPSKTGHFVIIDGYRPPGLFRVRDPAGERVLELRLARLMERYDGLGWWSHTYGTEP
jgi:hypothetical protein